MRAADLDARPRDRWQDASRPVLVARLAELAYLAGLALGAVVLIAFGFIAVRDQVAGQNDFTYAWAGARTALDGGDPYVTADWFETVRIYSTTRVYVAAFGYPPWVALGLTPLAVLPVVVASGLWTYGGMVLAALGIRSLLRACVPAVPVAHFAAGLALFASQPGTANVWTGQWSFLLVAGLAFTVVALKARRPLGLLAALALLGKPHLFVLAVPSLARAALARGGPRLLAALAVPLTAFVAVGWLAYPGWLDAWRALVVGQLLAVQPPTTLENAFVDLVGAPGHALAAAVVIALVAAGLRFSPRGDAFLAVWLAVSAATPLYSWSYDQLTLIVPLVVATGVVARRSPLWAGRFAGIAFALFLVLPMLLYVVATARLNESFSAFVPLAVAVLCLVALWRDRADEDAARPASAS